MKGIGGGMPDGGMGGGGIVDGVLAAVGGGAMECDGGGMGLGGTTAHSQNTTKVRIFSFIYFNQARRPVRTCM